MGLEITVGNSS